MHKIFLNIEEFSRCGRANDLCCIKKDMPLIYGGVHKTA